MEYIIFEDKHWENFLPFTFTRITGDLRCGILKLRQKIGLFFDFEPNKLVIRSILEDYYQERHNNWMINRFPAGDYTFINSRVRVNDGLIREILNLEQEEKLLNKEGVLAFRTKVQKDFYCNTENIDSFFFNLKTIDSFFNNCFWSYSWDLVKDNGREIVSDFDLVFYEEDNFMQIDPGAVAINPYNIWIGDGAQLNHGVVLDAKNGPIVIDEKTTIMHNSTIIGPAYIGKNSVIKVSSKIYENTSIGPFCKIGGEIEGSIIQGYSNKQHDGFLGHSYIGEWVNIGAGTNNSDLKNTYKPVAVWFYPSRSKINTNNMFVGTFIGDHSKIGINSTINTGSLIGYGASINGGTFINSLVKSFTWDSQRKITKYEFDKFIEMIEIVKNRRNIELTDTEIQIIKQLYNEINFKEELNE